MSKTDLASALNRAAGSSTSRAKRESSPPRKALRLDPAIHRRLRLLAVEHDTTAQKLSRRKRCSSCSSATTWSSGWRRATECPGPTAIRSELVTGAGACVGREAARDLGVPWPLVL